MRSPLRWAQLGRWLRAGVGPTLSQGALEGFGIASLPLCASKVVVVVAIVGVVVVVVVVVLVIVVLLPYDVQVGIWSRQRQVMEGGCRLRKRPAWGRGEGGSRKSGGA